MHDTSSHEAEICIIGAGSSGIAVGKALKQAGLAFDYFEIGSDLGGMWRYENDNGLSSAYRSLHIDTSRGNLAYSDFPFPDGLPDFLSHRDVLRYLKAYADHFGVRGHVRFSTPMQRVAPAPGGGWDVTLRAARPGTTAASSSPTATFGTRACRTSPASSAAQRSTRTITAPPRPSAVKTC